MTQRIQKAAVLGAGTMGARIAAHFANAGLPCLLLDIVPKDADARRAQQNCARRDSKPRRNRSPRRFLRRRWRRKISIGNFEDDLARIADADWIIEVVAENLEIKRGSAGESGAIPQTRRDCHDEHFRLAGSPHRGRIARGISAALGGHAFFQSAALHEIGGSDSRAEDVAGGFRYACRIFATGGWAKAW